MRLVVRITNEVGKYPWYADKVGEEYPYLFLDETLNEPVVDMCNSLEQMGSVGEGDYEIFEVDDDYQIRDFEYILTVQESEMLRLATELEVTQSALNDILMNMMGGE